MIEIPEITPIPELPQTSTKLTPVAIQPAEHPLFDPDRDGRDGSRDKKRQRSRHRRDGGEPDDKAANPTDSPRGTRVDIRA